MPFDPSLRRHFSMGRMLLPHGLRLVRQVPGERLKLLGLSVAHCAVHPHIRRQLLGYLRSPIPQTGGSHLHSQLTKPSTTRLSLVQSPSPDAWSASAPWLRCLPGHPSLPLGSPRGTFLPAQWPRHMPPVRPGTVLLLVMKYRHACANCSGNHPASSCGSSRSLAMPTHPYPRNGNSQK